MTREEIDVMWQKALQEAIAAGEEFTRYRFAEMVQAHEREECAKVCVDLAKYEGLEEGESCWQWMECAAAIRARSEK